MSLPQQKPQATDLEQCLSELRALLDDRLSTASDVRQLHGKDASFHEVHPPDAVAFVKSNEEVAEIVKCCVRYRIPIIPFVQEHLWKDTSQRFMEELASIFQE